MERKKFISWRRVSTQKQGRSGLGMEAQTSLINYFVEKEGGELIADYSEVYTGKDLAGCRELHRAIEHCQRDNAVLVIAKTDRFRNVREALEVYEQMKGRIYFCDLPNQDKFTLTIMFAIAEREAEIISLRTRQALTHCQKQIGRRKGEGADLQVREMALEQRRANSREKNQRAWDIVEIGIDNGLSYSELANRLNEKGIKTSRGCDWKAVQVKRLVTLMRNQT